MADQTAIYRDDATEDEIITAYQSLIDSGSAWRLEGSVGRTAMIRYSTAAPERKVDEWIATYGPKELAHDVRENWYV